MSKKVVLALSGGMDSVTLAGYYLDKEYEIHPITFNYGSKHNKYENEAASNVIKYWQKSEFPIQDMKYIELPFINNFFKSNLLSNQGEIPEGHYEQENMSLTVVPGRNLIFISIMLGYAWSIGADTIAVGVHGGDHTIYGDCRAGFIASMNASVIQASDNKVHLEAPFQYLDKTKIIEIGLSLNTVIPYHLTRTCYKDQEFSCGKCGSCQERLEAFKNLGKKDQIKYEE